MAKNIQEMHTVRLPLDAIMLDHDFNARKSVEDNPEEKIDKEFEPEKLSSLMEQIKRDGQLSPVMVQKLPEDDRKGIVQYRLICGFRRYTAIRELGQETIAAQVWDGEEIDAVFANLAENVTRKNLKSWEKAQRYHEMKIDYEMSGRQIANRLGESSGHVNNLIRIMEEGSPKIIELFRAEHGKATTDALCRKVIIKGSSNDEQWENWLKLCGLEVVDGEGDGAEGEGSDKNGATNGDPGKIRRPSMKHLEAAIEALRGSAKDEDFLKGARAALKWAAAKTKTLPGVYNPAKPPEAPGESAET